eukprot:CAMPEP_0171090764 /NCGR_PEP_ID=MMETSP0766_2-20121228/32052_1 /TAXON_ID=439317 /ORGANISM="Gambierdiscus australes, Strain CAWD 149" /LENGTH=145 /DNA_ID=CAMNT_0011548795 /DNA_START=69 /DNA_END=506 /DNA_ORIENTATION=-
MTWPMRTLRLCFLVLLLVSGAEAGVIRILFGKLAEFISSFDFGDGSTCGQNCKVHVDKLTRRLFKVVDKDQNQYLSKPELAHAFAFLFNEQDEKKIDWEWDHMKKNILSDPNKGLHFEGIRGVCESPAWRKRLTDMMESGRLPEL